MWLLLSLLSTLWLWPLLSTLWLLSTLSSLLSTPPSLLLLLSTLWLWPPLSTLWLLSTLSSLLSTLWLESLLSTPPLVASPRWLESTAMESTAMASVRPSPTPSDRSMVVSPSTMPTPLVTPTMLDIPATSPMAMVDIPSTDKFHVGCRTFWRNLSQTPERFTLAFSPITA